MLKLMLEGRIGEAKGWIAKKRLQKLAETYVKLKDMGLANMSVGMIRTISIIYETEYEKQTRGGGA